jgi:hypothetical protein
VRATRAVGDGHVVGEHDEISLGASGQEELYLVVSGAATFNVDGERVDAPTGTLVSVRNPAAKRSARRRRARRYSDRRHAPGAVPDLGRRGDVRDVGAVPGR